MLDYSDILQELFPDSPLFDPAPGEGLDQFLEGMAEGEVTVYEFLRALGWLRDPYRTTILSELEREFGVSPNSALSEEFRRTFLAALKYSKTGNGDADFLQDRLNQAGFDVFVYENSPAIDPACSGIFTNAYLMYAGDTLSQAGEPGALAGGFETEILVNGDFFTTIVNYLTRAGDTLSQAGEPGMTAGNYDDVIKEPYEYVVPDDADFWPCIFFVGGPATFAPPEGAPMYAGDTLSQAGEPGAVAGLFRGQITGMEFADIPNERREQFRRLILKIKPLHSWAVLAVNYV